MRCLILLLLTISFAARANRGAMSAYEGVVNSLYLGKQVYWITSEGTPLTAVITKVLMPDPEIGDTLRLDDTNWIKFEVRASLENEPTPVHPHEPRLLREGEPVHHLINARSTLKPRLVRGEAPIPPHYEDEDGGRWLLSDDFYQLSGEGGYTINSAPVIEAGFMVGERVHFRVAKQGEELQDYAGKVTSLVPSISGVWHLSIAELSTGSDLVPNELPTVFEPTKVQIVAVKDVKGRMKLPPTAPRPKERITTYYLRKSGLDIKGRVVATYSSEYWEFLNYTLGTDEVVEPYLFLVNNNDIMFYNSPHSH